MRAIKKSTKVVGRFVGFSSFALVLAVSNMASLLPKSIAAASGETITGDSSATSLVGVATNVGNLHITATGNPSEAVRLFVSHGSLAMTTITGLTFTGASSGATLEFNGTLSDVNTALATLQYTRNDLGSDTLEITLTGPGEVYDPATGHIYEYVYAQNPNGIDWPDSKAAADTMSTHGLTGYLATMTSSAENDYIAARLPDAGWMGASDAANEGDWKWVDGPETGMSFYSGVSDLNAGTTGVPVNGAYNDWNAGEPNDAGGNEDCGQFLSGSSGQWNDLPCDNTALLAGYVVEFGEPGHLANIAYKNVALSTTGSTVSASSCPELQALDDNPGSEYDTINLTADIDCSGYQVDPLFINGFYGTFDGHGHTISHITIDKPNDSEIGLISNTYGATIKNLTLSRGSVTGDDYIGGLTGYAYNTSIENVSSNLSVHAPSGFGGGLVGYYDTEHAASHISGSSASGPVDGSYQLGGIIGHYYQYGGSMTIEQTYTSSAIVSTSSENGGLIGYAYIDEDGGPTTLTIQDVYTRGDIDGTGNSEQAGLIGGLSANNTGATTITIQRAYTSGHITGDNHVAGFLGYNGVGVSSNLAFVFKNNFTATSLTSNDSASTGAMIGEDDTASQVIDDSGNYFDETTSALNAVCTGGQSTPLSDCTAIDTSVQPDYFKDNHSNQPMNTWDFSHIWHANAGDYPTFQPSVTSNDDNDGIPSAIEAAAPNGGDANGDGTPDDQQANVASFVDTQTGKYAVLAVPSACSVSAAATVAETANSVHDSGFNYPAGLMNFSLNCGTPGYSATITQYYYGVVASNYVVRKYDPNTHAYYTIPGASYSQTTIGGQVVTKVSYQVIDGSSLDTDGTANGTIVDPSGLGVAVVGVPNTGLGGRYR